MKAMTPERRRNLLLGALAVLVLVLVLRGADGSWLSGLLRSTRLGGGGFEAATEGFAAQQVLELAALDADVADHTVGRDPFRFGPPPGPSPEELARREAERRAREEAERRRQEELRRQRELQQQAAGPAEPPKPKPPPLDLTFLGSFGPQHRLIAVFADGEDILNAQVGDVIEEKFIVDQIGLESVDIKFVGFPDVPAQRLAVGG